MRSIPSAIWLVVGDCWDSSCTLVHRSWRTLCRVVCYLPVVWADEDEGTSLVPLLAFKLRRLHQALVDSPAAETHRKQMLGQLSATIAVMERWMSDDYTQERAAELWAKGVWPIEDFERGENSLTPSELDELLALHQQEDEARLADWRTIWDNISKYGQNWW